MRSLRVVPDLPVPDLPVQGHPEREPDGASTVPTADALVTTTEPTEPTSAIDQILARARIGWQRITAEQAWEATQSGMLLIDVRTEPQRREIGELPGAIVIDLTVLEWRLDPTCSTRIPEAGLLTPIAVICRQGYSSSLAVARLRAMGLRHVTDVIGGVEAWIEAGLPLHTDPADVRR